MNCFMTRFIILQLTLSILMRYQGNFSENHEITTRQHVAGRSLRTVFGEISFDNGPFREI